MLIYYALAVYWAFGIAIFALTFIEDSELRQLFVDDWKNKDFLSLLSYSLTVFTGTLIWPHVVYQGLGDLNDD